MTLTPTRLDGAALQNIVSGVTSITLAYPGVQTAGSTNIVLVMLDSATGVQQVTDTKLNTYTLVSANDNGQGGGNNISYEIWIAQGIASASAGANTVKAQWGSNINDPAIFILSFSPCLVDAATIKQGHSNAGATSLSMATATQTYANEYRIGGWYTSAPPGSITLQGSWANDTASVTNCNSQYQNASNAAGSTFNFATNWVSSVTWTGISFGLYSPANSIKPTDVIFIGMI